MKRQGVAWYDVRGPRWLRDIFVILHPPYTLWHLSYVLIGAAMADRLDWGVLGWTYLAFFLGMGIGGHCLDELNGRPLKTKISGFSLSLLAAVSLAGAITIGVVIGVCQTIWVIPCIVFGGFIVFAYNLEWGRGFFHHDFWFGFAWGAFPAITAYIAQEHTVSAALILIAAFSLLSSWAQRVLSLHARYWRRKVGHVSGDFWERRRGNSYASKPITVETIISTSEVTLKFLNAGIVILAIGMILNHI